MSAFSSQNPLYGLSQRPSNQGWLFHPKMPYTGNQDNFSAATGVHSNRFQYVFIQTQSIGGKPPIPPKRCFASMQGCLHRCKHPVHEAIFNRPTAYAAGVPERGFFRCRRKRMARLVRDMRKCASYIFLDERPPFRCWEIVVLYIFFGLVEHLRRR